MKQRRPRPRLRAPAPAAAPVRPATPAPVEPPAARAAAASVAKAPVVRLDFEHAQSTSMFETLGGIRALPSAEVSRAIVVGCLKEARGYSPEQIAALSEIGYHYLRSGGERLAAAIFDGLAAIDPDNAWVALAQGLARDNQGQKDGARRAYARAARLDPRDARALVNLAELDLQAKDRGAAKRRLRRALKVARASGTPVLERKARALLQLAGRPQKKSVVRAQH